MNTGHDGVERGLRQHEQQHRPGDPAEQRCRPEAEHARPLPGQLAPVADGAGHGARDEADRVRHVGRDGRVAEGEQDRKGDQVPLPTRVLIAPAAMPAAAMAAISAAPTGRRS